MPARPELDDGRFLADALSCVDRLCAWLKKELRDEQAAEELAQDTLAEAWLARRSFRGASSLSTWMHGIARNLARSRLRKADPLCGSLPADCLSDQVLHGRPDGEWRRLCADLMVENLNAADRELYRLFYRERRPISELAKLLGQPEGTIKYRLFEIRRRLSRLA